MPQRRRVTLIEVLMIVVLIFVAVSVLAPTLERMRESSRRQRCPSNLKQIGQAILLYAIDHGDATPDSLTTVLRTEDLVPAVFICDGHSDATAAPSNDAFAADPGASHCSYDYTGDRQSTGFSVAPANAILVLDRANNHDGDGVNALFGDGHVEFLLFGVRGDSAPWWLDVQSQIARGVRPVMLPTAATQPAER